VKKEEEKTILPLDTTRLNFVSNIINDIINRSK
jgi:hypothetical protein